MKLHVQTLGAGEPLVLLHGLLGSSDNWLGVAKSLADRFQVFALDLRNHGRSPHAEDMSFDSLAEDVGEFIAAWKLPAANVIGHSLGGKVAMHFTARHPGLVRQLVVVDIAPKPYPLSHRPLLDALLAVDLSVCNSRSDAEKQLVAGIPDQSMRQFLLKNLERTAAGQLQWRCHLAGISRNYEQLAAAPELPAIETPALFLTGGKSDYVLPPDRARINATFRNAQFAVIPQAGHWVHAEAPEEFVNKVELFL